MKGIKKSMFITTVLMVVLTVVAVSTATLAWFSASDSVTVTQTTITAANSTTASIGIGWSVQEARTGYRIAFANPGTDTLYNPIMPFQKPRAEQITATETDVLNHYIATNVEHAAEFAGMVAGGVGGKNYARVYADEVRDPGRSITVDESEDYVEDANIYDKIYKTVEAVSGKHVVYTNLANVPVDVQFDMINADGSVAEAGGYEYLTIVVSDPEGAQITVAAATALSPEGAAVQAGSLLYKRTEISAEYAKVSYGSSLSAGTFIPNGMKVTYTDGESVEVNSDYVYVVDAVENGIGQLSESGNYYDITVTEAKSYITTPALQAADGEFIYAIEKVADKDVLPATYRSDFMFVDSIIDGQGRFKSDGVPVPGVPLKANEGSAQNFYIRNNGAQPANIEIAANITGVNASRLRIAVFVNGQYRDTITDNTRNAVYGAIVEGAHQNVSLTYNTIGNSFEIGELAPDASFEITIYAWYDGRSLTATEGGGQAAQFSLDFNAIAPENP